MLRVLLLPLGIALLAPFSIGQCNDTTYKRSGFPGEQAPTVQHEACAGSSVVLHLELSAGGSWKVVEAETGSSITLTISQKPQCESYVVKYSGALMECLSPLEGTHCYYPKSAMLDVSIWKADPACPQIAPGAGGWSSILGDIHDLVFDGYTHYVECNPLVDVTDEEIPEDEQVQKTARIRDCNGAQGLPDPETSVAYLVEGAAVYAAIEGDPLEVPLGDLFAEGQVAEGVNTIEGLEAFLQLAGGIPDDGVPQVLVGALDRAAPVSRVEGLGVHIESTYYFPDGDGGFIELNRGHSLVGDFEADGDFALTTHASKPDGEGGRAQFTFYWVGRSGDIYYCQEGDLEGLVYPKANGSAAIPRQQELWALGAIQSWVTNPLGAPISNGYDYAVEDLGDGRAQVTRSVRWVPSGVPGIDSVASSLLGGRWRAVLRQEEGGDMWTE